MADLMREEVAGTTKPRVKEEPDKPKCKTSNFKERFPFKNYQERRYCIVIAVSVESLAYLGHSVKITNN